MRVRSLGYRSDLMTLRMRGSQIEDRGGYLVVRSPATPDFWWGNFLLFDKPPLAGASASWLDVVGARC